MARTFLHKHVLLYDHFQSEGALTLSLLVCTKQGKLGASPNLGQLTYIVESILLQLNGQR